MQVAVLTDGNIFGVNIESCFWSFTRIQELGVRFAVGQQLNPLNVVRIFHRVGDTADLDRDGAVAALNDRHLFLGGGINRVFGQQLHVLSAADQITAAGLNRLNDVAAEVTFVDFKDFCHGRLLFIQ